MRSGSVERKPVKLFISTGKKASKAAMATLLPSPNPNQITTNGAMATADDIVIPLTNFTREIQITDIAPNLRQINIIMSYTVGRLTRTYTLTTYMSSFA